MENNTEIPVVSTDRQLMLSAMGQCLGSDWLEGIAVDGKYLDREGSSIEELVAGFYLTVVRIQVGGEFWEYNT